jgi:type IV pilus assembly protein PilB
MTVTSPAFPAIDLAGVRPMADALARVPASLAQRHGIVPLGFVGDTLHVATHDPTDTAALDEVRLAADVRRIALHVAPAEEVERTRRRAYASEVARRVVAQARAAVDAHASDPAHVGTSGPGAPPGAPIVALLDALLADAVAARASDLHVEPTRDGLRVRLRVDGTLTERVRLPSELHAPLVSRIKVIAQLDIAERRLPQDGRTEVEIDGTPIDVRIATMPTWAGESVVLRLLPRGAGATTLSSLGLSARSQTALTEALTRPQGLVLVTGPTGSGKTTTLHTAMVHLGDGARHVLTLEDPIEMDLPGATQTQVDPRIGLTFATGLRHALRHDPDVLLVGEVRDRETAALAVEAAFTGHLVLATLHTLDAPSALARLVDLGADATLLAPTLLAVVAQRLARTTCRRCAVPTGADPAVLARLGVAAAALDGANLRRGTGCAACEGTGVLGRTAVDEVLAPDPTVRAALQAARDPVALDAIARRACTRTLRDDAVARAASGAITLEEALRVSPDPLPVER